MPTFLKEKILGTTVWIATDDEVFFFFVTDPQPGKRLCEHTFEEKPIPPTDTNSQNWHPCPLCRAENVKFENPLATDKVKISGPEISKKMKVEISEAPVSPDSNSEVEKQTTLARMAGDYFDTLTKFKRSGLFDMVLTDTNMKDAVLLLMASGWDKDRVMQAFMDGNCRGSEKIVYEEDVYDNFCEAGLVPGTFFEDVVLTKRNLKSNISEESKSWAELVSRNPIQRISIQEYVDDYVTSTTDFEKTEITKLLNVSGILDLNNPISYRPAITFLGERRHQDPISDIEKFMDTETREYHFIDWTIVASRNQFSGTGFLNYDESCALGRVFFVSHTGESLPSVYCSGLSDFVITPNGFEKAETADPTRKYPVHIAEIQAKHFHMFEGKEHPEVSDLMRIVNGTFDLLNLNIAGIPRLVKLRDWSKNIRHAPKWPYEIPMEPGWSQFFASCEITSTGLLVPLQEKLESGQEITVDFRSSGTYSFCGPKCPVFDLIGAEVSLVKFILCIECYDVDVPEVMEITKSHLILLDKEGFSVLEKQTDIPLRIARSEVTLARHRVKDLKESSAINFYKNRNVQTSNISQKETSNGLVYECYFVSYPMWNIVINVIVAKEDTYEKISDFIVQPHNSENEEEEEEVVKRVSSRNETTKMIDERWKTERSKAFRTLYLLLDSYMASLSIKGNGVNPIARVDEVSMRSTIKEQCKALKAASSSLVDLDEWAELFVEWIVSRRENTYKYDPKTKFSVMIASSLKAIDKKWTSLHEKLDKDNTINCKPKPQAVVDIIKWTKRKAADAFIRMCESGTQGSLKDLFGAAKVKNYATLMGLLNVYDPKVDKVKRNVLLNISKTFVENYEKIDPDRVSVSATADSLADLIMNGIFEKKLNETDAYVDQIESIYGESMANERRNHLAGVPSREAKHYYIFNDVIWLKSKGAQKVAELISKVPTIVGYIEEVVDSVKKNAISFDSLEGEHKNGLQLEVLSNIVLLRTSFGENVLQSLEKISVETYKSLHNVISSANEIELAKIADLTDKNQLLQVLLDFKFRHFHKRDDTDISPERVFLSIAKELCVKYKASNDSLDEKLARVMLELDVAVNGIASAIPNLMGADESDTKKSFKELTMKYVVDYSDSDILLSVTGTRNE